MAQVTLNSTGVASSGALVLQSNGTTTAVTVSTGQVATLVNDAVVNGLTVGRGNGSQTNSTVLGNGALAASNSGQATGVGFNSLAANTTGRNVAVGLYCLTTNTTGTFNNAFGDSALYYNTTGGNNTAVGVSALQANTTASNNTAVGYQAAYANTTGTANTAHGRSALSANTTGNNNTASGLAALQSNTTGGNNTAHGVDALVSNTTASNNTAVGYQAGYAVTTGATNAFFGQGAGVALTTGIHNTFIGRASGEDITTGTRNSILGRFSGNQGGLDIRTSSNYIVLSDGDGNPRGVFDSSGNLLVGTTSTLISTSRRLQVEGSVAAVFKGTNSGSEVLNVWQNLTTGNNVFIEFDTETSATARGTISYNRSAGLVAYNTTSDYRAKDIYGLITDSGALIDSVPVYMGKMKGATQERPMFIAHETPDYAHTGEKDAIDENGNPKYQQMDATALVPVMWAEIQSLRKRLAAAGI